MTDIIPFPNANTPPPMGIIPSMPNLCDPSPPIVFEEVGGSPRRATGVEYLAQALGLTLRSPTQEALRQGPLPRPGLIPREHMNYYYTDSNNRRHFVIDQNRLLRISSSEPPLVISYGNGDQITHYRLGAGNSLPSSIAHRMITHLELQRTEATPENLNQGPLPPENIIPRNNISEFYTSPRERGSRLFVSGDRLVVVSPSGQCRILSFDPYTDLIRESNTDSFQRRD